MSGGWILRSRNGWDPEPYVASLDPTARTRWSEHQLAARRFGSRAEARQALKYMRKKSRYAWYLRIVRLVPKTWSGPIRAPGSFARVDLDQGPRAERTIDDQLAALEAKVDALREQLGKAITDENHRTLATAEAIREAEERGHARGRHEAADYIERLATDYDGSPDRDERNMAGSLRVMVKTIRSGAHRQGAK